MKAASTDPPYFQAHKNGRGDPSVFVGALEGHEGI